MYRWIMYICLLLIVLTANSNDSRAQTEAPFLLSIADIESGTPVNFHQWKYHPGDNPDWADSDLDDGDWLTIDARMSPSDFPNVQWRGLGWFRLHLQVDSSLVGKPLALVFSQWGASEIYVNGFKKFEFGRVGDSKEERPRVMPLRVNPSGYSRVQDGELFIFSKPGTYVLAVRYSNHSSKAVLDITNDVGFDFGFWPYEQWRRARITFFRYVDANVITLPILMVAHILFVFWLYWCNPKQMDNLYLLVFIVLILVNLWVSFIKFYSYDYQFWMISIHAGYFINRFVFLFLLLFMYSFFQVKISPLFWLLVIYSLYAGFNHRGYASDYIQAFITCALTLWTQYESLVAGKGKYWSIHIGILLITISNIFLHLCMAKILGGSLNSFLLFYLSSIYIFLIATTFYFAKRFANTFREIETLNVELEDRVFRRTAELEKANQELLELDQMKSQFVSQASHDLRTPLTAIKGSLDNLLMGIAGDLNDKQSRIMERATKSVDRLTNLINDVLDLNRIETGRIVLEKTDIPFKSLVENIIHENHPAADQKQIKLLFEADEGDYTLHVDGGKIERVVGELVSNAIKYTPEKGKVDVKLSHDGSDILLSVKDSGIGMSNEECNKIWERFYRTTASKKFAKGSGLGLSIAKELVELHEGSLLVESGLGKGSAFTLCLPIKGNRND